MGKLLCTILIILRYGDGAHSSVEENSSILSLIRSASCIQCFDTVGWEQEGNPACKNGGQWRRALFSTDGVAPSRMVNVSASVNLPLHHKVQKFSSGTGSPGWSVKRAIKRLW